MCNDSFDLLISADVRTSFIRFLSIFFADVFSVALSHIFFTDSEPLQMLPVYFFVTFAKSFWLIRGLKTARVLRASINGILTVSFRKSSRSILMIKLLKIYMQADFDSNPFVFFRWFWRQTWIMHNGYTCANKQNYSIIFLQ